MNLLWPTCTFVELETGDPLEGYKAESNLVKMEKKKKWGRSCPEPCSRLGKVGSRLDFSLHLLFCPAPLCSLEQLYMASLPVKAFGIGSKYPGI